MVLVKIGIVLLLMVIVACGERAEEKQKVEESEARVMGEKEDTIFSYPLLDTTSIILDHQDSILVLYGKNHAFEKGYLPLTRKVLDSLKKQVCWKEEANGFEIVIYDDEIGEYKNIYLNNSSKVEQGLTTVISRIRNKDFHYYLKEWPCLGWTVCIDYKERYVDNEYQELNIAKVTEIISITNPLWKNERGLETTYICNEEEIYKENGKLEYKGSYEHTIVSKQDTCFLMEENKSTGKRRAVSYWVKL